MADVIDTDQHPAVVGFHQLLDNVELAIPTLQRSESIEGQRMIDRAERKVLERRAQSIFPEAGIDPDDTADIYVPPAVALPVP